MVITFLYISILVLVSSLDFSRRLLRVPDDAAEVDHGALVHEHDGAALDAGRRLWRGKNMRATSSTFSFFDACTKKMKYCQISPNSIRPKIRTVDNNVGGGLYDL